MSEEKSKKHVARAKMQVNWRLIPECLALRVTLIRVVAHY